MFATHRFADYGCDVPSHVRIGSTPEVLAQINEPGVNLAIWERDLPEDLSDKVDDLYDKLKLDPVNFGNTSALVDNLHFNFYPRPLALIASWLKNESSVVQRSARAPDWRPNSERVKAFLERRSSGAGFLAVEASYLAQLYHRYTPQVAKARLDLILQLSDLENGPVELHQDGVTGDNGHTLISFQRAPPHSMDA